MKPSGLLLCTFRLNRVFNLIQILVLMSVCWTYHYIRVEATTCDCGSDCVSYCTADVNLALGRPTAQSSTAHEGAAGRAVDGNTDGNFFRQSCTHTNYDSNPWWGVDLGKSQAIGNVVVFNREDCCQERLNNFRVHVGDSPTVASNPQCGGNHAVTAEQQKITVDCGGLRGRYVGISLPTTEPLTLCEVRVYKGEWLTRHSSWVVSSAGTPWVDNGVTYDAAKALDGNGATYWNPLGLGINYNNWYIILDLTASHTLTRIALNNYGDTIHDIKVFRLQKSLSASPYNWEDVVAVTNVPGGTSQSRQFGGFQGTARYWKFVITQTYSGWQPWLGELYFFGTSGMGKYHSGSPASVPKADPEQSGCEECEAGYYCPVAAGSLMSPCPAGHYCTNGTHIPQPCPNGTFSNVTGLAAAEDCSPCPPGFYCETEGLTEPTGAACGVPSVAVGNPPEFSPAPLIAVSVVAGVAIVLAVATSILYIGNRLELRKVQAAQPLLDRDASYRSFTEHPYEAIPGVVGGPPPMPAARAPPVRHTDIELQAMGPGMGHQGEGAGGPTGGMYDSSKPGGNRVPVGSPWTLEPDSDTASDYVFENDGESDMDVE